MKRLDVADEIHAFIREHDAEPKAKENQEARAADRFRGVLITARVDGR